MLISSESLFSAAGLPKGSNKSVKVLAQASGLSLETIKWLEKTQSLPDRKSIKRIAESQGLDELAFCAKLGFLDDSMLKSLFKEKATNSEKRKLSPSKLTFQNDHGHLYQGDCMSVMAEMENESVDLVFADPPFNLDKDYPSKMNDALKESDYLSWCVEWLDECCRILKFGGSMFIYNLPKWNLRYSEYLMRRLTFRHAVSIRMAYSLPISGRLYPAHYSMIYLCKGPKPSVFTPDRTPMQTCPKCFDDLVDYGGYKSKMNPSGVSITDVWTDIPPVRHNKYKRRKGANELSLKLLDRVIEMASKPGQIIFDPFGGSGTTYAAAEAKGRKWIGCELGPVDQIIDRIKNIETEQQIIEEFRKSLNALHPEKIQKERVLRGLWTTESVRKKAKEKKDKHASLFRENGP